MTATERVATVQDEYDFALTDHELFQIAAIARTAPNGHGDYGVDRVLMTDGTRLTGGTLVDTYANQVLRFRITGLGVYVDVLGWQPIPDDDQDENEQ